MTRHQIATQLGLPTKDHETRHSTPLVRVRPTSSIPQLHRRVEIPRTQDGVVPFRRLGPTARRTNTDPRFSRGRPDGVGHDFTALRFVDGGLPMQRPGEVGLGGETLLRLEVVEALLEEGTGGGGGACWSVGTGRLMDGGEEGGRLTGLPCILSSSDGAGRV